MLKRFFWLGGIALAGWLIWQWVRRRQHEFSDHAPQFAPTYPYQGTAVPAPTPAPTPAAPAELALTIDELFADEPVASAPDPADTQDIVGYCMRCHAKRPIAHAREEISESGRRAARGTCPVCGTNMFTFLPNTGDEQGAST